MYNDPIPNSNLGSSGGVEGIHSSSSGVVLGSTIYLETKKPSVAKTKSKKKHIGNGDGKLTNTTRKEKDDEEGEAAAAGKKGPTLREDALKRGVKVVACRARGMPMDHNIHVSVCVCVCFVQTFIDTIRS
jgi:hypothetical protein